ncbi:MAG: DUF4349 domain-containing protein [Bacteroidota bacterium]
MKLFAFCFMLVIVACSDAKYQDATFGDIGFETEEEYYEEIDDLEMASGDLDMRKLQRKTVSQSDQTSSIDRKIIRTADVRIKVEDIEKSSERIENVIGNYSAYISNSQFNNNRYNLEQSFTIRVPMNDFSTLLETLEKEAIYINHKNTESKDVTEEYLDIETRLRTKKEVRARYEDILRNKAKTVEDVLAAEEAIRVIQEEIEAKEGRLQYLKNQVSYSTINLKLYQEVPYVDEPNVVKEAFGSQLIRSLKNGWELILNITLGLVTIWPILLILGLLIFGLRRVVRRRRKKVVVEKEISSRKEY